MEVGHDLDSEADVIRVTRHDTKESVTVDHIDQIQGVIRKAGWGAAYYTLTQEPADTFQADVEIAMYLRSWAGSSVGLLRDRALEIADRLERHEYR